MIAICENPLDALLDEFELTSTNGHRIETDLVIDELDGWRNPHRTAAGGCIQTFNLVILTEEHA